MARRVYEELRTIVEQEGGEMVYERNGHAQHGAWVVTLRGIETIFPFDGAGFGAMDPLYVPKVAVPLHWRDYSIQLIPNAREKWLAILGSPSTGVTHQFDSKRPESVDSSKNLSGPHMHRTVEHGSVSFESAKKITPPFEGASEYLDRVKAVRGLPERNMEDLVKELLVRLGHSPGSVLFQIGYIDVLVNGSDGKPRFVLEVKPSLRSKTDRDSALRQAFDYANRNGAPIVIITDADTYEIYDRQAGLDHASMLRAKFQLTGFKESDVSGLEFLKP